MGLPRGLVWLFLDYRAGRLGSASIPTISAYFRYNVVHWMGHSAELAEDPKNRGQAQLVALESGGLL
jgi:hypothetical protein